MNRKQIERLVILPAPSRRMSGPGRSVFCDEESHREILHLAQDDNNTAKPFEFLRFAKNDSGIILPVVLWIVLILSVIVFSLGRSNAIEIALTKHSIGKMRSYYLARSGVMYALEQIYNDAKDPQSNISDSGRVCGFVLESDKTPEELFKNIALATGYFDVSFLVKTEGEKPRRIYGLADEESKINLNALNSGNFRVLSQLLALEAVDGAQADEIAAAAADWHDGDSEITETSLGAENSFYESLSVPYKCKNLAFDQVEELLLVKGMTPDIFKRIQDYVTVFPKDGVQLKINGDTASENVLKAVVRSLTAQIVSATFVDADQVAERLAEYRKGDDGIFYTADDKVLKTQGMHPERDYGVPHEGPQTSLVMNFIGMYHMPTSRFLHVTAQGVDNSTGVRSEIEAIVDRSSFTVVEWKRNN